MRTRFKRSLSSFTNHFGPSLINNIKQLEVSMIIINTPFIPENIMSESVRLPTENAAYKCSEVECGIERCFCSGLEGKENEEKKQRDKFTGTFKTIWRCPEVGPCRITSFEVEEAAV